MSSDSLKEIEQTKTNKVTNAGEPKTLSNLSRYFSKLLLTIITILVTATVTWYVNYRLNHLKPVISITNIEFFFDLEGQKELIEIPNNLIKNDQNGFFRMGLKHFMTLEDLSEFTKGNRTDEIKKRYRLFEKEIEVFLNFLSEKPVNYELLSQYTLDFLASYGFNGVTSFLIFLEEENLLSPLNGTKEEINKLKTDSGNIMLSHNAYLITDAWSSQAKSNNQKHMAAKIEWFAKRIAYNHVKKDFFEIKRFLDGGKALLDESRKHDLYAENGIVDVIEEKAKKYKKVRINLQMVNRSDFPLVIAPICTLQFSSFSSKDVMSVKSQLDKYDSETNVANRNNLFKAFVINPKETLEFSIKSKEIEPTHLEIIKQLFKEKKLRAKVEIQAKLHKGKNKKFNSEWILLLM